MWKYLCYIVIIKKDKENTLELINPAINEIYVREQNEYTGSDYKVYFFEKEWYHSIEGKVIAEEKLNIYEKMNIDMLVEFCEEYKEKFSNFNLDLTVVVSNKLWKLDTKEKDSNEPW